MCERADVCVCVRWPARVVESACVCGHVVGHVCGDVCVYMCVCAVMCARLCVS